MNTPTPLSRAKAPIKIAFILSAKHSGSTWLNLVLGSHTWAANVGEFCRPFFRPGHTACRLCEAKGLEHCAVLGDVSQLPIENAFRHAAKKLAVQTVIDSSKRFDWVEVFENEKDHEIYIVHLIRHPCGYIASRLRRDASTTAEAALKEWETENLDIFAFKQRFDTRAVCVSYEDLALDTEASFLKLTSFLGGKFERDALRYWNVEHHGLGGNGANYVYLRDLPDPVFVTGDQAYYEQIAGKEHIYDDRWRTELDQATINWVLNSDSVANIENLMEQNPGWTGD